jgi:hypothetical protein
MATIRLDRIDQILRQINADAKQTELIFRDIAQVVDRLQTASLAGMHAELRHAAKAAMQLDKNLKGAAEAQQRMVASSQRGLTYVGPAATQARMVTGGLSRKPGIDLPEDKGAIDRLKEFERVFGLTGKSARDAAKYYRHQAIYSGT